MKLSSMSLVTQMLFYFSLLVLTPLIIIIILSYATFTRSMGEEVKKSIQQSINYEVDKLEVYYSGFTELTTTIVNYEGLWRLLEKQDSVAKDKDSAGTVNELDIAEALRILKNSRNDVMDIGLFTKTGGVFHSVLYDYNPGSIFLNESKPLQSSWYQDFIDHGQARGIYRSAEDRMVFLSRINNPQTFTEFYGTLIYELDIKFFDQIFQENVNQYQSSIYLFNEQDELIYHRGDAIDSENLQAVHSSDIAAMANNSKRYLVVSKHSNSTNWSTYEVVPYKNMMKDANSLRNTSFLLVLVSYFAAVCVTFFLGRQVVRPLKKLMIAMRQLGSGSHGIIMKVKGPVEVQEITKRFNTMELQIGSLITNVVEEQQKVREADLSALQAQIHPHFLYNTLNLIVFLARKNKVTEIQSLTGSLIEFLQNSLKTKRFVDTIANELRMIEHYVLLHQHRAEGKVSLFIEADPDLLGIHIPKFILQPLVENAIFHGIYPKDGHGSVRIVVQRLGNLCEIRVIDDGVGLNSQLIPEPNKGLGMKNVRQRFLKYFTEGNSGMDVAGKPGIGTVVVLFFLITQLGQVAMKDENRTDRG